MGLNFRVSRPRRRTQWVSNSNCSAANARYLVGYAFARHARTARLISLTFAATGFWPMGAQLLAAKLIRSSIRETDAAFSPSESPHHPKFAHIGTQVSLRVKYVEETRLGNLGGPFLFVLISVYPSGKTESKSEII